MDPSFYYQAAQNPNLLPKMSKMNPQQMQNLKPGFSYPENQLYNYSQAEPQMDLYRAVQVHSYPEKHNQYEPHQNQTKSNKNPKGGKEIVEVFKQNLEEEFNKIMDIIEEYNLIALVNIKVLFKIRDYLLRIRSFLEYHMATIRLVFISI
jgi:hypothetical protein